MKGARVLAAGIPFIFIYLFLLVYHLINKKIRKKGKIRRGAYLKVGNEYWCNVQGDRKEVELLV